MNTHVSQNAYTFKIEPDAEGGRTRTVSIGRHNVHPPVNKISRGKKARISSHLLIGFDTEYQSNESAEKTSSFEAGSRNDILSYQFCVKLVHVDQIAPPTIDTSGIIIPSSLDDNRISMEDFVRIAIGSFLEVNPEVIVPPDIYLIGHFTRADLPAFSDFKNKAQTLMANVRSTFLTLGSYIPVPVSDDDDQFVEFKVRIRDTIALAPANAKSLAEVGKIVGLDKITLADSPGEEIAIKSNMARLREENWPLFKHYAIRDAEVCVRYAERILRQHQSLFDDFQIPATLTSFGTKLVISDWKQRGIDKNDVLGREEIKDSVYDKKKGYYKSRMTSPFIEEIYYDSTFVIETFHGGRNEQFIFGVADEGDWRDLDLSSAYPTAMTMIGLPDWRATRQINSFDGVGFLDLAYFSVDFEFPDHIRFPTLPVRTANGIIFPRKGNSKCVAPELDLAIRLGAKCSIKRAVIVPTDPSNSVFGGFIRTTIESRNRYPKGTFDNLFWKEVGNSTYGKTAQGLRKKRTYDLREDDMVDLPESEITQPYFAAFITSYVRAVLGEILNTFSPEVQVFSVTTDGFLTNASEQEVQRAQTGPLLRSFMEARKKLVGNEASLEVKHRVRQPIGWRTRGSATLKTNQDDNGIVLQKGGLKTNPDYTLAQENSYTINQFINRTPDSVVRYKTGAGIKDMIRSDIDFVFRSVEKHLSMEFDWKRNPTNVRDVTFTFDGKKYTHLSFDTEPLATVAEFNRIREGWEAYSKSPRRNLKTVVDFEYFHSYLETNVDHSRQLTKFMRKSDGDLNRVRQDLCIAFKKFQAGFDVITINRKITHKQFCESLEACGISCKPTDVENGKKKEFKPHNTIPTPRVVEALRKLKAEFYPELDIEIFLAEGAGENHLQSDQDRTA